MKVFSHAAAGLESGQSRLAGRFPFAGSASPNRLRLTLAGGAAVLALSAPAGPFDLISDSERTTAVSSKVYNGYARARAADGSLRPETYAMGIGGLVQTGVNGLESGAPAAIRDDTIGDIGFGAISSAMEGPLASQAYFPTTSAAQTDLLIMVYWGRTQGPLEPATPCPGPTAISSTCGTRRSSVSTLKRCLIRGASRIRPISWHISSGKCTPM